MPHRARAIESLEDRQLLAVVAAMNGAGWPSAAAESAAAVAPGSASAGAASANATATGASSSNDAGGDPAGEYANTATDSTPGNAADSTPDGASPGNASSPGASVPNASAGDSRGEYAANAGNAVAATGSADSTGNSNPANAASYAYQAGDMMAYRYSKNAADASKNYDANATPNNRPTSIPLLLTPPTPGGLTPTQPPSANGSSTGITPGSPPAAQIARSDDRLAPRAGWEPEVEAGTAPLPRAAGVPAVWVADSEFGAAVVPYDQPAETEDELALVEKEGERLPKNIREVLAGAIPLDLSRLDAGVEQFISELDALADDVANVVTADRVAHWMIVAAGAGAAFEFARNGTRLPTLGEPALIEGWRQQIRRRLARPLRGPEVP